MGSADPNDGEIEFETTTLPTCFAWLICLRAATTLVRAWVQVQTPQLRSVKGEASRGGGAV